MKNSLQNLKETLSEQGSETKDRLETLFIEAEDGRIRWVSNLEAISTKLDEFPEDVQRKANNLIAKIKDTIGDADSDFSDLGDLVDEQF